MKKIPSFKITTLILTVLTVGLFASVTLVAAQATPGNTGGQALEIAPPIISLTADPGQTINTQIELRDVSTSKLVVTGQINDFVPSDEVSGIPKIVLDDSQTSPYSIKKWVTTLAVLTLDPKQIKQLPVTITVPVDASPGGYYGVVRFTALPPGLKDTGVSLSASLGSLVFIRVNGDAKEKLAIEGYSVDKNGKTGSIFESAPINFAVRLKNTGNIYEQPVGQISITDMFNKKVADVNVNLEQRYVLPASTRKFEQPLDSATIGNKILFGRYRADLRVAYGDSGQVLTQSLTFWVIPYTLIIVSILAIVVGFLALRFAIIRYNRYIISKSGKSRRQ